MILSPWFTICHGKGVYNRVKVKKGKHKCLNIMVMGDLENDYFNSV